MAAPGFDDSNLSKGLLDATFAYIERHDLSLRVSDKDALPHATSTMAVGTRDLTVKYSRSIRGRIVKDFVRTVVLNNGHYQRLERPQRAFCLDCDKLCVTDPRAANTVVPVAGQLGGEYFLLYGCTKAGDSAEVSTETGSDEDEDDKVYSQVRSHSPLLPCALACAFSASASNASCVF